MIRGPMSCFRLEQRSRAKIDQAVQNPPARGKCLAPAWGAVGGEVRITQLGETRREAKLSATYSSRASLHWMITQCLRGDDLSHGGIWSTGVR
jgi:hypothetical protein